MSTAVVGQRSVQVSRRGEFRFFGPGSSPLSTTGAESRQAPLSGKLVVQITAVFVAYLIAGKLGQATTSIRSSNLGPVWPAYGIALAAFLAYGYRVWPGIVASAFLVAFSSSVPPLAAAGQAVGATVAALTGALLLRRLPHFDPSLSRLRDALGLVVLGAFGSAVLSASIGLFSLYATHVQPYSGLASAWLIYWLGDSTGVLLITPLVFTVRDLVTIRSRAVIAEFVSLLTLLTAACFVVFGDLPLIPVRLHVLAFAVLPFVMWAAIDFGIGGASLSVFLIATIATIATALGLGPFAGNTSFINAVLLDVLFAVLAVTGLALAAVIAERERAKSDREHLIREQAFSSVNRRLILAQEEERARIARELHDDIGQRLAMLAVDLTDLSAGSGLHAGQTARLVERASEIATDIQSLSHELHSSKLDLLGITAAMKGFCDEFSSQQHINVSFETHDVPARLSSEVSLCLFRVLQEALHNSAKHSGAGHLEVQLWGAPGEINLLIADAGAGFELSLARAGRGLGLVSMEERLKLVGGALFIETQPRRGTRVHARAPQGALSTDG